MTPHFLSFLIISLNSCLYSTLQYSTVQYSTVQYSTWTAARPHPCHCEQTPPPPWQWILLLLLLAFTVSLLLSLHWFIWINAICLALTCFCVNFLVEVSISCLVMYPSLFLQIFFIYSTIFCDVWFSQFTLVTLVTDLIPSRLAHLRKGSCVFCKEGKIDC